MSDEFFHQKLQITSISKPFEKQARQLILNGLEERFGFLDSSFNPDLADIMQHYSQPGFIFLTGIYNNEVVCTGALTEEEPGVGRIQRMSVKKSCRRIGIAGSMLQELEARANKAGYKQVVLETNNEWHSAIEFYRKRGYRLNWKDEECSHFLKILD